jgi:hypothetical protein
MSRPDLTRVPDFYHGYINKVEGDDLNYLFQRYQVDSYNFFNSIPEERWSYRYAEGKWSIKELVQHLIDAERIFSYRALRFARNDKTTLAGFEEDSYVPMSNAEQRRKNDLVEEIKIVNTSSALLFKSFDEEMLEREGIANGSSIYVRAIGFIIIGHALHHRNTIRERYLNLIENCPEGIPTGRVES